MRVLITGLEGFTGRYLRDELVAHGHDVIGLAANLIDVTALGVEIREVQPDWVAHLAGIAFVGHGEPNDFYRVNLQGTRNLFSALSACGKQPKCVLLASSANVYGNSTEGALAENAQLNPANDYAVSKLAMEYMARLWMDKLPITIIRPFNYTGVGQSELFLIPKIVEHVRRRASVIELGNLDVWRDFSDVRFVARVYRLLLEREQSGEIVNVCSGRTASLREVVSMASTIAGYDIEVRVNPAFVRPNEVKILCGESSKLRRMIGGETMPPLAETLLWMIEAPA